MDRILVLIEMRDVAVLCLVNSLPIAAVQIRCASASIVCGTAAQPDPGYTPGRR